MKRITKLKTPIHFVSYASVGGYEEKRGPLGDKFDFCDPSDKFGQKTWEIAESEMGRVALNTALSKAKLSHEQIGLLVAGDLQNQCVASSGGLSSFGIPFLGVYGACSTCTESIMILRNIRLPLNQVGLLNKISKESALFEQRHERRPTSEELSDILDIPAEKIDEALSHSGSPLSVDAPFEEGESNSLLDVLPSGDTPTTDKSLMNESLATEIDRALSTLSDREKEILQMLFGIGCQEMTLEEIGDHFGLTRERVRQVKEKALRRLRSTSRSTLLKTYL